MFSQDNTKGKISKGLYKSKVYDTIRREKCRATSVQSMRTITALRGFLENMPQIQPGLGGCTEVLFNVRNKTLSVQPNFKKVSVPPYIYVPPTSKQLQQNKWRQIHPPYWSNIRQVALGNFEC
jgi:hypothetical protein